jgi:hypothetical protein
MDESKEEMVQEQGSRDSLAQDCFVEIRRLGCQSSLVVFRENREVEECEVEAMRK